MFVVLLTSQVVCARAEIGSARAAQIKMTRTEQGNIGETIRSGCGNSRANCAPIGQTRLPKFLLATIARYCIVTPVCFLSAL
jgi:hypothetical protein